MHLQHVAGAVQARCLHAVDGGQHLQKGRSHAGARLGACRQGRAGQGREWSGRQAGSSCDASAQLSRNGSSKQQRESRRCWLSTDHHIAGRGPHLRACRCPPPAGWCSGAIGNAPCNCRQGGQAWRGVALYSRCCRAALTEAQAGAAAPRRFRRRSGRVLTAAGYWSAWSVPGAWLRRS